MLTPDTIYTAIYQVCVERGISIDFLVRRSTLLYYRSLIIYLGGRYNHLSAEQFTELLDNNLTGLLAEVTTGMASEPNEAGVTTSNTRGRDVEDTTD